MSSQTSRKLFCGICEASCGLVATVDGDELVRLRPDPDHPNSRGFACSKGIGFPGVRNDPDRVLHPLKRGADGYMHRVSWEEALDDIGRRLRSVIEAHGKESIGLYLGNPTAWNYSAQAVVLGMSAALGTKHLYTAASLDINNYLVVSQLLYGHNAINPFPDLHRTDFFLVLGANPVLSHGSMMTVGRIRETMVDIRKRGGRVVVVDPRRNETAELFEHVPIRPDSDAWLVAAMLRVVLDEGLADERLLAEQSTGWESLRELVAGVELERAARETGIPAAQIAALAHDFARAPAAVLYGRCGASLGRFSTLTKYLIDAFNLATGNLDRPGGSVFGHAMLPVENLAHAAGQTGYDRWRTRVDGLPEVMGTAPVATMAREIETPGSGQLRALFACSGNFVSTGPAGPRMSAALRELDLFVSLDLYETETNEHADYILPPTTWLERDIMPLFTSPHSAVPHAQWVPATLRPAGEARDDWWIIDQICRRSGLVPSPMKVGRLLGKIGIRPTPAQQMDLALRLSSYGDLFGLRRGGLSRKKLWAERAAIKLADRPPTGALSEHVYHKDKRVHLDQPLMREEMRALIARSGGDPDYPLQLISLRELRGQNSWMHNVPKLMAADRVQRLRVHPGDAAPLDLEDGDQVELSSRDGAIEVRVAVTDEVMPGVVALPQGWGHRGGWKRAVTAGGANYNDLASSDPADVDRVSGQAILNGIRVRLRRAAVSADPVEA